MRIQTNGDGVAVNFITPAGVVSQNVDASLNITHGAHKRLANIESLYAGNIVLVALDKIR